MCHVSNYFSEFLWLLNVFFVLIVIRSYEAHLQSKTCLWIHCNVKFWIWSNSFLDIGHGVSCVKQFVSISMIAEILLLCLLQLEATKFIFLSWACLRIHCNSKFWICSNSFFDTGHDTLCEKNVQCFCDCSMSFFVLITNRSHNVHC